MSEPVSHTKRVFGDIGGSHKNAGSGKIGTDSE